MSDKWINQAQVKKIKQLIILLCFIFTVGSSFWLIYSGYEKYASIPYILWGGLNSILVYIFSRPYMHFYEAVIGSFTGIIINAVMIKLGFGFVFCFFTPYLIESYLQSIISEREMQRRP